MARYNDDGASALSTKQADAFKAEQGAIETRSRRGGEWCVGSHDDCQDRRDSAEDRRRRRRTQAAEAGGGPKARSQPFEGNRHAQEI